MNAREQELAVRKLKQLLTEHDSIETLIVCGLRRCWNVVGLWSYHDSLERAILSAAAMLPQSVVDKVKKGTL